MIGYITGNMSWGLAFVGLVGLYFTAVVGVFTPALIESLGRFINGKPLKTLRDYQVENEEEELAELEAAKTNKKKKIKSEKVLNRIYIPRRIIGSQRNRRLSYRRSENKDHSRVALLLV